ncbi:sugar phosphate nucleotidyltransferase [Candidatus Magnetominusculus dajiuhuensis]|uniref:sugar phosphate nucleotidyltransferase n=1 Tax=Candidatus Magnetominusculus dajiuhuensis TaxID=3137712 RepID=UPI003B435945
MQDTDVIILAGGLGMRLRPVVDGLPKVLAPVAGRPFLDILLGYLNRWVFIRRVVIAVGFMADKIIREYDGPCGYNFEILFSREDNLLGTGGAVIKAVAHTKTPEVIAINGDTFAEVDFEDFVSVHVEQGAAMTIALRQMSGANRYGTVAINAVGRVVSFHEKTPRHTDGLINAGVYVFHRELFDHATGAEGGAAISLERDILPSLLSDGGDIRGYVFRGRFIDIGVPEAYNVAGDYLFGDTDCGGRGILNDNIENST